MACILLWSSAVRVHDSQAYRKMDVTRERISRILELREILLSIQYTNNKQVKNSNEIIFITEFCTGWFLVFLCGGREERARAEVWEQVSEDRWGDRERRTYIEIDIRKTFQKTEGETESGYPTEWYLERERERKDERSTTCMLQSIEKLYGVCTEPIEQKGKLTKPK